MMGIDECKTAVRLHNSYGTWHHPAQLSVRDGALVHAGCGTTIPLIDPINLWFYHTPAFLTGAPGQPNGTGFTTLYVDGNGGAPVSAVFWGIYETAPGLPPWFNFFFSASWRSFTGDAILIGPQYDLSGHSAHGHYRVIESSAAGQCYNEWNYVPLVPAICPFGGGCTQDQTDTFIPLASNDQLESCLWNPQQCSIVGPVVVCDPEFGCGFECPGGTFDMLGADKCCTCPLQ